MNIRMYRLYSKDSLIFGWVTAMTFALLEMLPKLFIHSLALPHRFSWALPSAFLKLLLFD